MSTLTDRKKIHSLTLLCTLVYFISYVSRINLSATLVEVVNSGFATKASAAMALTLCSVTYGTGQLISGYLGDRYKPQNIILIGFLITATVNGCVGFLQNDSLLVPLWAINGFAQALMWPPLVAIMSSRFSPEDYQVACVRVSWGSSFGTIAVYLLSPLIIRFTDLRFVFFISSAAAFTMLIVWKFVFDRFYGQPGSMQQEVCNAKTTAVYSLDRPALLVIAAVLLCVLLQGFLRDGVTNWTPSYISETFHLSSSVSILSGVILPLFAIFSFQITSFIYRRYLKNELICSAVIFAVGAVSSMLLTLVSGKSVVLSLICLALLVGSMHGVNMILTSMIPLYFGKYGKVSLVSGIVNSGAYIGSALSAYGTALYSETFGWSSTILMWSVVAFLGTAFCFLFSKKWKLFKTPSVK